MQRWLAVAGLACACVCVAVAQTAGSPAAAPAANPTELPPGPAKTIIERSCTVCHGPDMILSKRGTPDDWAATVSLMVSRGADLTDQEIPVVVKYLSDNFPPPKSSGPAGAPQSKLQKVDPQVLAAIRASGNGI